MAKSKKNKGLEFFPQCFTLALDVFPPIAMGKENALKLATKLAVYQDLTDIHMSDESWTFRRPQVKGHARGHIQVSVEEQEVTIEHQNPNVGLERFEMLVDQTVEAIGEVTKTQMIFGIVVTLEYTAKIGRDARKAILGSMGLIGDDDNEEDQLGKLAAFERPCHFVGLRLGFPAFRIGPDPAKADEKNKEELPTSTAGGNAHEMADEEASNGDDEEGQSGSDWIATITLQSLQDDPEGLSVEVSGRWIGAKPWADSKDFIVGRLRVVDEFLRTKTTAYLEQFRGDE